MDKQTVTIVVSVALGVFTIIGTILPSVFWSHGRLSDQIMAIDTRLDDIDNRLVAVETTLDVRQSGRFVVSQQGREDAHKQEHTELSGALPDAEIPGDS